MLGYRLSSFYKPKGNQPLNLKLRNRLSEILLKGLEGINQTKTLAFFSAYCQAVHGIGTTSVMFKDLSLPKSQTLSGIPDVGIIFMEGNESDPVVDLLPQFRQDIDYLCDRVAAYRRVLSQSGKISGSPEDLDWAVRLGVLLFNEGLYFECHEFLEGFWRKEKGETKEFLQGIISLATALYHLERGNRSSAIKLLVDGRRRLQAFGKAHKGLGIEPLLEQTEKIQTLVEEGSQAALEQLKRMPSPTIQFHQ